MTPTNETPTKETMAKAPKKSRAAGDAAPVMRKKELIDRVIAATGAKKKPAKEIVEATLKALGDALAKGETLAVPPFGKARVNRQKDLAVGELLTVKLRRGPEKTVVQVDKATRVAARKAKAKAAEEALAVPAELITPPPGD